MSNLPEGATPFDHPDWSRTGGDWFCWTAAEPLRMSDLVGKVVNVGTKDGEVYEAATVADFTDKGFLVLEGGRKGFPWSPERGITDMDGREDVHCHDIARGYVHPDDPR